MDLDVGGKTSLLIADDDRDIRFFTKVTLEEDVGDFEVLEAEDGSEALAMMESERPDLVLLDIQMPGLSGIDVLTEMARRKIDIPVVIITVLSDRETVIDAMTGGALHFINKPFEISELVSAISLAFKRHKDQYADRLEHEYAFINAITHEMRTAVQAIQSFSSFALEDLTKSDTDAARDSCFEIAKGADRLGTLVEQVLVLSKIESGSVVYRIERHDLAEMVRETIASLRPLIQGKGIEVRLSAPARLDVEFDRQRLWQVVTNIINNAIKFTPEEGRIEIELDDDNGACRLVVSDSGCGIPEAELDAVFERFYQSTTTVNRYAGTGLGLAICYEIIRDHHGRIEAANNPDGGARITVELPKRH